MSQIVAIVLLSDPQINVMKSFKSMMPARALRTTSESAVKNQIGRLERGLRLALPIRKDK